MLLKASRVLYLTRRFKVLILITAHSEHRRVSPQISHGDLLLQVKEAATPLALCHRQKRSPQNHGTQN